MSLCFSETPARATYPAGVRGGTQVCLLCKASYIGSFYLLSATKMITWPPLCVVALISLRFVWIFGISKNEQMLLFNENNIFSF